MGRSEFIMYRNIPADFLMYLTNELYSRSSAVLLFVPASANSGFKMCINFPTVSLPEFC